MQHAGTRRLNAADRAQVIMTEVQRAGFASITVLSRDLGVSDMTIRRDVRRLADSGELRLVHGGVSLPHGLLRTGTYAGRAQKEADAKRAIAEAAASLLGEGDSVVIDSGTTCFAVTAALPRSFHGTVITHSVPVLQQMLVNTSVTVLCLGGELLTESQVLIGPRTTAAAKEVTSDVLLLGANSVDGSGVYLMGDREYMVKRSFIERASKVVLLVDGSKLTRSAPVRLAGLDEIDVLVTSGRIPDLLRTACSRHRVEMIEV